MTDELVLELLKLATKNKSSVCESTANPLPFEVGGKYYIRTVTYHVTGQVKEIVGKFLVMNNVAWIADSGRFRQAIVEGILDEVEPVEDEVFVNTDSITDAYVWKHKLPREQK
mgnify:CR=1 FL=1